MIKKPLILLDRNEIKNYIFDLQKYIQSEQDKGKDIDTILDETNIFDELEEILPDNEFPIFVITILNGFKSDILIDKMINIIKDCKNDKK